jgi:hypothetical protein
MCVSRRHLDRLMTHQFSYCAQIHTRHHQALANVCRKQYQVKKLMPALRSAGSNQCL